MSDTDYIVYAAAYENPDDAMADFASLKQAGLKHITAALVLKDDKGRIHVHEKTFAGKAAGAAGIVGGAVLGIVFPPAGVAILADAVVGGAVAGTIGHFAGGISRKDLKELGGLLDDGEAGVVAIGVDAISADIDKALGKASKKAAKHLDKGDVDAALADINKGINSASDKAAKDLGEW